MPLFINEQKIKSIPSSLNEFLKNHPHFKVNSKSLKEKERRNVPSQGLLYVGQREYAGTDINDDVIKVIGSEDATTCHMIVLRHTGSKSICVSHFDGCGTEKGLKDMLTLLQELSETASEGRIEIHLIGGFTDKRKLSEELSLEILNTLCQVEEEVHLVTACITGLNTTLKKGVPYPFIYGIGVDVQSGEIFPAKFKDKGPDLPLRSARHFTGTEELINIYDHKTRQLCIGPFHYSPKPDADRYCQLPNPMIRKYLSTSPEQEPKGFEDNVRAAFIQIRDFPRPHESHFSNGSRRYKMESNGVWALIK